LVFAALLAASSFARADAVGDEKAAYEQLKDVMPVAQSLELDGRADEAELKILAVFPQKSRTLAQSLLLGNLLFDQDPKTSYALHKAAATALPNEYETLLEWAMEQHRAGEYAAASQTYDKLSKLDPLNALIFGLHAECQLRVVAIRPRQG
jgi:hypothetical protein